MKSNYTWINYNRDNIAIISHIMIHNFVWNLIFGVKFSSIYLSKGEKLLVFIDYHLLTCIVRKMVLIYLMQNIICVCCIHFIQLHDWYHTLLITFPNECLPCNKKMLLNLVAKNEILHIFLYHEVTSCGYMIVDTCMIPLNLNFIMQLKQFYNIATTVSSNKMCYYFWWFTRVLTEKLDSQSTSLKRILNTATYVVTNEVIQVKDHLQSIHSDIVDLCKESIMSKTRLIGMETYSKRENLWFGGIPDKILKSGVFLQELHITDSGDIMFVRIDRMGRWNPRNTVKSLCATISSVIDYVSGRGLNWRALDVMSVRILPPR